VLSARAWTVEHLSGSAAAFHARELAEPPSRSIWWLTVERPALVLGSTQHTDVVDGDALAAAGVDVVHRRSGGGAVLLVPGDVVWTDVIVPAGDDLWDDDVGRAAHWLGDTWSRALMTCGVVGTEVHRGRLVSAPWSSLVCFAGLGPGEVHVGPRKVVGVSQRRTRGWARFQCALYRRWDPGALVDLLAPPRPSAEELADLVLPVAVAEAELRAAFVAALP
jgi:lipoate---protein ligase